MLITLIVKKNPFIQVITYLMHLLFLYVLFHVFLPVFGLQSGRKHLTFGIYNVSLCVLINLAGCAPNVRGRIAKLLFVLWETFGMTPVHPACGAA